LQTGCLLCIGTYACVIGIFLIAAASSSAGLAQLPARLPSDLRATFAAPTTFLVAVLYLVFTGSAVAFFPREGGAPAVAEAMAAAPTQDAEVAFREAWLQQPRVDLGIDPEGAKVVIVKFLDYQCPSCRAAHLTYAPVLEQYAASHPGAVRQVARDYPLNSRCNFTMTTAMHPAACEEAALVRLARDRGQADEVVDWLFSLPNQTIVTPEQIRAEAERRFGVTNFDQVYQEKLPGIRSDVADGAALHVNSTPTYFINGVRAQTEQGWLPAPYFDLAIKIELDRAADQ
jgi:thiol-disulfide isomerase/thioredoxin